jgi:CheY-like chemotaxis protein
VLVAEDEDMVRSLIRIALRWNGYTVLEARNGTEALALAERHPGPIHLLVTDVVMPRVSGPELARKLRSARPETRVLYISGYTGGDDEFGRELGNLSAEEVFLPKPFTPDALVVKVKEMLEG